MRKGKFKAVAALLAGITVGHAASAAPIVWNTPLNISGPGNTTVSTTKTQGGPGGDVTITNGTTDVSTLGKQVFGVNFSGKSGSSFPYNVTINNQLFASYRDTSAFSVTYATTGLDDAYDSYGPPGTAGQSYGNSNSGGVGPNPDYTLANAAFGFATTGTVTLGNLTPGRQYQLQFWVSDPRGNATVATRTESLASSTGNDSAAPTLDYEAPGGGLDGQWVIGSFTADNTGSETINLTAGNSNAATGDGGSVQMNLLQLRDITNAPEPASWSLLAAAALGMLRRRRRKC